MTSRKRNCDVSTSEEWIDRLVDVFPFPQCILFYFFCHSGVQPNELPFFSSASEVGLPSLFLLGLKGQLSNDSDFGLQTTCISFVFAVSFFRKFCLKEARIGPVELSFPEPRYRLVVHRCGEHVILFIFV